MERAACKSAGMDHCLSKPVEESALLAVLKGYLPDGDSASSTENVNELYIEISKDFS
jgi:hypothetical protein